MSSSAPVWVVLAVAALGVVGTLAASILTQVLSAKREQQERQEQWKRQDTARWLGRWRRERFAAYSEWLTAAERWEHVAEQERPSLVDGRRWITAAGDAQLTAAEDEILRARTAVELLAPEDIRVDARTYWEGALRFRRSLDRLSVEDWPDDAISTKSDELLHSVKAVKERLRQRARQDLGIDMQDGAGSGRPSGSDDPLS